MATALNWVSKGETSTYMGKHRHDENIDELVTYFDTVLDWVTTIFINTEKEMKGLEWGRLYETYKNKSYDPIEIDKIITKLYSDPYIKNQKGIFEYVLGGEEDKRLLDIRVFDEATKKRVYKTQTDRAKSDGISNCPLCATGQNANKTKIYSLNEMDADHVHAWSKGGKTDETNCELLCITHNRSKGNK